MALVKLVIRSQLVPPRQRKGVLRRARIEARLAQALDYPLTIVQAGTGYGKSTALASLSDLVDPLFWYTITEPDRDPLLFLAHLISAFDWRDLDWCEPAMLALEASAGRVTPDVLTPLINAITVKLPGEAVLVLDDYHLVGDVPEISAVVERLVNYVPPQLHVIISSRRQPSMRALTRWQAKGQVLSIGRRDLAFTVEEIETLFREQYGAPLSAGQARSLATETEGWAIALQMVWQRFSTQARRSGGTADLDAVLHRLPASLEALFDYLAQEVLERQEPAVQRFLLTTSVLRQLDGPVCDYLLETDDSAGRIGALLDSGLFLVSLGDRVARYHRLFHDFLRSELGRTMPAGQDQDLHRRAARFFRQAGQAEETIYHLLGAGEHVQSAELLEEMGAELVATGRLDSLTTWIGQIPDVVLAERPDLGLLLGDVYRLRAQFDQALEQYGTVERGCADRGDRVGHSRALQGQAQIYLDTVRPLMADSLLQEALGLLGPEEHPAETATLLDKLAENRLNLGNPAEAEALHHEARLLREETDPGDIYLEARAMLRTGRLADARRLLERRAEDERQAGASRVQRFHRETVLLLSLVHALEGNAQEAESCAREGLGIAKRLRSTFVEAVGNMRLGHAVQMLDVQPWAAAVPGSESPQLAIAYYRRAIDQIRAFGVMRTRAEPLWGLCRAHGYTGNLIAAEETAKQALEIIERAGDEWVVNLIRVTLGASYSQAGQPEPARAWLAEAASGFSQVGDSFGNAVADLWRAVNASARSDGDEVTSALADLLPVCRARAYDHLLTKRTFLGPGDEQAIVPLLIEARERGIEADYARGLLEAMGMEGVAYHPGYTLYVRTLGPFTVWRGRKPVTARNWRREKARRLFQFLLTNRGQWFIRDQIIDHLWPHLPSDAAERDFKVALNALNRALEPDRPAGASPFFVIRRPRRNVYGLNPQAPVVVDAGEFETLSSASKVGPLRQAVALYQDDYLPGCLYEDWASATRHRLQEVFLSAAERLAQSALQSGAWDEVIDVCERILARDDCWEEAYRLLMRVHAARNNRPQIHAAYQRCVETLQDELDVEPSTETQELFLQLG